VKLFYPVARILGRLAERGAGAQGIQVTIALVDEKGLPLFYGRMDGTLPASFELAISKAYTAAALGLPTQEVGDLAQPGKKLYGIQNTHQGRIVLFGGGLPLRLGGKVVGGVGISGGTVEEDIRIAELVVGALEAMEKWSLRLEPDLVGKSFEKGWMDRLEAVFQGIWWKLQGSSSPDMVSIITGAALLASRCRT
jgi:uncharacterized protein GlcG (DUF336 family)